MKYLDELFHSYSFSQVWDIFIQEYPDSQSDGYKSVFDTLSKASFSKYFPKRHIILIKRSNEQPNDNEEYVDMTVTRNGKAYSMSFINWHELLGYRVDEIIGFTELQILAHFLWEATFYGFDEEEIENIFRKVTKRIKAIDKMEKKS